MCFWCLSTDNECMSSTTESVLSIVDALHWEVIIKLNASNENSRME